MEGEEKAKAKKAAWRYQSERQSNENAATWQLKSVAAISENIVGGVFIWRLAAYRLAIIRRLLVTASWREGVGGYPVFSISLKRLAEESCGAWLAWRGIMRASPSKYQHESREISRLYRRQNRKASWL